VERNWRKKRLSDTRRKEFLTLPALGWKGRYGPDMGVSKSNN
jgi:hypothetical protein